MSEEDFSDLHIFKGRFGNPYLNPNKCARAVPDGGRSPTFHQCNRKPKVTRTVKGKEYGFCATHDPVALNEKYLQRQAKWEREWKETQAKWDYNTAMEKAHEAAIEAIRKIAAGHNDPRTLANEVLKMIPAKPEETK